MMTDVVRQGIAMAGGMILTPLLIYGLSKLFPVRDGYLNLSREELKLRNDRIDGVATFLAILGIFCALPLYFGVLDQHDPWGVGLGFGLMVILPISWIALATLPKGFDRWLEFWDFYQLKYRINSLGLICFFSPLAVLGFISVYKILSGDRGR